jgi:hypothetical protein
MPTAARYGVRHRPPNRKAGRHLLTILLIILLILLLAGGGFGYSRRGRGGI